MCLVAQGTNCLLVFRWCLHAVLTTGQQARTGPQGAAPSQQQLAVKPASQHAPSPRKRPARGSRLATGLKGAERDTAHSKDTDFAITLRRPLP